MPENKTIAGVTEALRGLGLKVVPLKATTMRAIGVGVGLRVGKGQQAMDYLVDQRGNVTSETVGVIAKHHRQWAKNGWHHLLVTRYVPPGVAERLRALGIFFADTAGNAYLEGPDLLVFVIGRKLAPEERPVRGERTFTPAGIKVVFALLCNPEPTVAPQRKIALAANVALGAVPGVLADLRAQGYLVGTAKQQRLERCHQLLDEWTLAYARALRPKTLTATFTTPLFEKWRRWPIPKGQVLWGGEPAAQLLGGYLQPGVLTLYAEKLPPQLIIQQRLTRLVREPDARDHVLEIRAPFWGKTLKCDTRMNTVAPVLVYGDLLATGDARCIETAQMIHEHDLARLLGKA